MPASTEHRRIKQREYARLWRERHPEWRELQRGAKKRWEDRNPEKAHASRHRRHLRSTYGITPEQYQQMLIAQGNVCAICKQPSDILLVVDHDHDTDTVRGLLCGPCNRGLGLFRDSPTVLEAASRYLRCHSA